MIDFVVYDEETGEILRVGRGPEAYVDQQAGEGEAVVMSDGSDVSDAKHYVDVATESIIGKTGFPGVLIDSTVIANSSDSAKIERVPHGTVVSVNGLVAQTYTIEDGMFEISVNMPGMYSIACTHPKHFIREYLIEGINQESPI